MKVQTCKLVVAAVLITLAGCSEPLDQVVLLIPAPEPKVDYSDLAFMLDKGVTTDGLLIPKVIEKNMVRLDQQLKLMKVTGPSITPELFTSEDAKLAYWYNARAAWAMKLAVLCDCPEDVDIKEYTDRAFILDGRRMVLEEIDEILVGYDDWQILVAAPGVTLGRAHMPDEPFAAYDVRRRIGKRFNAFVDDRKRFVIDIAGKKLRVPAVLWGFRKDLINQYESSYGTEGATFITALLPHTSGSAQRRLQDAVGYRSVPAGQSLLLAVLKRE